MFSLASASPVDNRNTVVENAASGGEFITNDGVLLMNMAKTVFTTSLAALAFVSFAAFADTGLYVGGSVGSATLSKDLGSFKIETESTPYRFTFGLQLHDFFALEGGYQNFGSFEDRFTVSGEPVDIGLKADGFTLGFTGSIPLSDRFSLFGRGGAFFWDGDALIDSVLYGRVGAFFWDEDVYLWEDELYIDSAENSVPGDTNAYFGGGLTMSVTDRLDLVGDWTRYNLETARSDVFSLGFTYRF